MNERVLRASTAVLACAGAAITAYLLTVRLTGTAIACATGGCETVQHSAYAEVLGVPVSAVGLVGFLAVAVAAAARGDAARAAQATLALTALFFSAYLFVLQVAVIGAICQWCVAADVVTTAIAALSLLRFRAVSSPGTRSAAAVRSPRTAPRRRSPRS